MAEEPKSNSGDPELERLLQRVENLKDEQKEIAEQIKDVKAEAAARGYDMAAFSAILTLRAKKPEVRQMIGVYADNLGVFG